MDIVDLQMALVQQLKHRALHHHQQHHQKQAGKKVVMKFKPHTKVSLK